MIILEISLRMVEAEITKLSEMPGEGLAQEGAIAALRWLAYGEKSPSQILKNGAN